MAISPQQDEGATRCVIAFRPKCRLILIWIEKALRQSKVRYKIRCRLWYVEYFLGNHDRKPLYLSSIVQEIQWNDNANSRHRHFGFVVTDRSFHKYESAPRQKDTGDNDAPSEKRIDISFLK